MNRILEVNQAVKTYGKSGNITRALDGISFRVNQGEFIGIMGASGSGKTTLWNCISTIDNVTSCQIHMNGRDITRLRANELAKFRREELGFIFQDFNLLDSLTGYENIALALTIMHTPYRVIDQKIIKVARQLNISAILKQYPYQMSGGQKQRIACARALVTNPSLILADEPTGNLDSKSATALLENFNQLNDGIHATIIIGLLYAHKKNEELNLKNILGLAVLFGLACLSIGSAYALFLDHETFKDYFIVWTFLGGIGTWFFFISLSAMIYIFMKANPQIYFKGLRLFVIRLIQSKTNTAHISMTMLCGMLSLSIVILSMGISSFSSISLIKQEDIKFDAVVKYDFGNDFCTESLDRATCMKEQDQKANMTLTKLRDAESSLIENDLVHTVYNSELSFNETFRDDIHLADSNTKSILKWYRNEMSSINLNTFEFVLALFWTLLLYVIIYGGYVYATYAGSKNLIKSNR